MMHPPVVWWRPVAALILCLAASLFGSQAASLAPIPDKLVVLTFDDSVESHHSVVRPLLKKYGFGATFFITEGFTFKTNKKDYLTWQQIAELHRDGFEIGNHTRDHMGVSADTLGRLREQVEAIQQRCVENGIPAPTSFAYPGNAIFPGALPVLKELGFRFARRGGEPEHPYKNGRGRAVEPGADHPLLLPTAGDARPDWTLDDFRRAVAQARDGRFAILQFHGVPDREHPWVHTPPERFAEYLEHLARNGYTVIALRDLARYLDPENTPADPMAIVQLRKETPRPAVNLRVTLKDSQTSQPLPGRVYLRSAEGRWFYPDSTEIEGTTRIYQKRNGANTNAFEFFTTVSAHPFEFSLAPGRYQLIAEHGKEYLPATNHVELSADSKSMELPLRRWVDLPRRGWYSGDTHIHRTPGDLANVMQAEDVNVVFPMTQWTTVSTVPPAVSPQNMPGNFGREPVVVDPTHVWYPRNSEYEIFRVGEKSHTVGAFVVIHHQEPFEQPVFPLAPIAAQAHRERALIDLEKHNWPWTWTLVPLLKPHLYELANNHNWQTEFAVRNWGVPAGDWMGLQGSLTVDNERDWIQYGWRGYYGLLNCGFRIAPTASTGHGVHPVALGFSRVYVHLDKPFSFPDWVEGLKHGNSFVTTGPLLLAQIEGFVPGEIFRLGTSPRTLHLTGELLTLSPKATLEIVVNGEVVATDVPNLKPRKEGGYRAFLDTTFDVQGPGWIAARCFENREPRRFRFAHTAPWWIEVRGHPIVPKATEARWFLKRAEEEVARNRGVIPEAALQEFEQAVEAWKKIVERAK